MEVSEEEAMVMLLPPPLLLPILFDELKRVPLFSDSLALSDDD